MDQGVSRESMWPKMREGHCRERLTDVVRDQRYSDRDQKYIRSVRGQGYVLTNTLIRMLQEEEIYSGRQKPAAEQAAVCSLLIAPLFGHEQWGKILGRHDHFLGEVVILRQK